MTLDEYLDLIITSQHRLKPNFISAVSGQLAPFLQIQSVLSSMVPLFDIDDAAGDQLDILGKWIGLARNIAIPIDGVFFSFDSAATLGWDYGTWQPTSQPTSITILPDDAYRTLLRAKIASNFWDGTTNGAYAIWDRIFPTFKILIQDANNTTYAMALTGGIVDSLTLALLTGGYIPLKPAGVRITEYFVSVDSNPIFGWDVESAYIGGWDEASFSREILPT